MGGGRRPKWFIRGRLQPGKDSPSHQRLFAEIDFHVNMLMPLKHINVIAAKKRRSVKQPKSINDLARGIER